MDNIPNNITISPTLSIISDGTGEYLSKSENTRRFIEHIIDLTISEFSIIKWISIPMVYAGEYYNNDHSQFVLSQITVEKLINNDTVSLYAYDLITKDFFITMVGQGFNNIRQSLNPEQMTDTIYNLVTDGWSIFIRNQGSSEDFDIRDHPDSNLFL